MQDEVTDENEWTDVGPRLVPYSLAFLLLAVAAYLIQIPPYVGIFTMLLLAPAWPMLCIVAAAVGLVVECVTGKVSRWWLMLPLVTFAVYETIAVREQLQVRALAHGVQASNAAAVMTYDPAASSLVLESGSGSELAKDIVANTSVPVAYAHGGANRTITKADCASIRAVIPSAVTSGIQDATFRLARELDERACSVRTTESPTLPVTRVETTIVSGPHQGAYRTTTRITAPSGRTATVSSGVARPMSLVPFLVAGCILDGGSPHWRCFAFMTRDRVSLTPSVGYQNLDAREIARVLGLAWTARSGRRIPSDPAFSAKLPALAAGTASRAENTAMAVMSGSAGRIAASDLAGMILDERILPERSRRLVAWSARTLGPGRADRPEGRCRRNDDQSTAICLHAARIANAKAVVSALDSMKSMLPDDVAKTVRDLKTSESVRSAEMDRTRSRRRIERKRENDRMRSMVDERIMERIRTVEDRRSEIREVRRRRIEEAESRSAR